MDHASSQSMLGNQLTEGTYQGIDLTVCVGGMGVANAAATAQFLIDRYQPQALIFSGIAGSINPGLSVGDILVGAEQHYAETNTAIIAECPPYQEFFPADSRLLELVVTAAQEAGLKRIPSVRELLESGSWSGVVDPGRLGAAGDLAAVSDRADREGADRRHYLLGSLSTSDRFNTDPEVLQELVERFAADGEAMEEAAAAQICGKCQVPFLCIRGISNPCGQSYEELNDQEDKSTLAADEAGRLTLGVLRKLAAQ
ncbi:5'-methylthioadenosine/S-adenosylhomocysteine nucleosidase family protein [Bifidobacterium aemilianum]